MGLEIECAFFRVTGQANFALKQANLEFLTAGLWRPWTSLSLLRTRTSMFVLYGYVLYVRAYSDDAFLSLCASRLFMLCILRA